MITGSQDLVTPDVMFDLQHIWLELETDKNSHKVMLV